MTMGPEVKLQNMNIFLYTDKLIDARLIPNTRRKAIFYSNII